MSAARPVVPVEVAGLAPFAEAGVLDAAEVQVAAVFARRAPGTPEAVLLAIALATRAPRFGHVCIELATIARSVTVDDLGTADLAELPWPDPAAWAAAVEASPLVARDVPSSETGPGAVVQPVVWDGRHLTLDRYARYERSVAEALRFRSETSSAFAEDAVTREALLDRFFGPDPARLDRQRQAAEAALVHPLAVIAGGPGTGKTRTVARLLAAVHQAAHDEGRSLQVALVAPTGKAAARLTEAVHHEIGQLDLEPAVAERMRGAEALTVHRLLGRADGIRFRRNADDPVPHDLVVVDEASMASLPLVARLLDALRPAAHVVLVGDPDQLASVEAGAVLGEIVRAGGTAGTPLGRAVVVLERVHRFGAESGIAALAGAIRAGDTDAALALLDDPARPEVRRIDPGEGPARAALDAELADAADAVVSAAADGDADRAWSAASATKVLTAARRGPNGLADWQLRIESPMGSRHPDLDPTARWYVGRPVMVSRNDYVAGLFNGDAGIVVATPSGPQVAFPGAEGWRHFEPSRLDELETWWAMTIHKSQGSEFDHAVVALPAGPSPLLARELLYTGVTRARERVTVVATAAAVRAAIERPVTRASNLAHLLGGPGPHPTAVVAPADVVAPAASAPEPVQLSLLPPGSP